MPQIADAVKVPVIAAGGIADGRGIAAAFALGARGVQIGSAYLHTPESKVMRVAQGARRGEGRFTVITNVMTGRPARGVLNRVMREAGPISPDAPAFPHAATALAPSSAAENWARSTSPISGPDNRSASAASSRIGRFDADDGPRGALELLKKLAK